MRRIISKQSHDALYATVPRTLTVIAVWLAYVLVGTWLAPFIPWWVVTLAGILLYGLMLYIGSELLVSDVLRESRQPSDDAESSR